MVMNHKYQSWIACIITMAFIADVVCHEEEIQKCFIEHLFHFDLDHETMKTPDQKEKDREDKEKAEKLKELKQWCYKKRYRIDDNDRNDNDYGEGTSSGNDSNDCNRDRN